MILPSDADPPSDKRDGESGSLSGGPGNSPWWSKATPGGTGSGGGSGSGGGKGNKPGGKGKGGGGAAGGGKKNGPGSGFAPGSGSQGSGKHNSPEEEEEDFPLPPDLQTIAGPGWRSDLCRDLLESLRELQAIEDPEDEFAPPEPPDLYTFFGELAALRNELRHRGQRADGLMQDIEKSFKAVAAAIVPVPAKPVKCGSAGLSSAAAPPHPAAPLTISADGERAAEEAAAGRTGEPGPWSAGACLALVSLWDLLPQAASATAFERSFQPLLSAAGLARVETGGKQFDPATMTMAGTEKAPRKKDGIVLREVTAGFFRHTGQLLRPAAVIVGSPG